MHEKSNKKNESKIFPSKCELCDKELKSSLEKKTHMKHHSYKLIQYKCEECDFCGTNSVTMDVHVGNEHSENECGMCEYIAKDKETLETTCLLVRCMFVKIVA